ncbi:DNA alkylation repair protein [Hoyosella sp. YIM 151337]|uniref:DNA alkylation repair protein n=1 Tax=Hoyosella sp. YIM 151337 TaxID=2992742 RepID=UPI00223654DC|nr:DNA alkylation repair protein [Hoyosella sp. YIM 151337]MCW4354007.1 DNA alkylation repair protein [Hoyosella sp. YIM 151337]
MDAPGIIAALEASKSSAELANVRKRLQEGEDAFGVRMRVLFDLAKANATVPLTEVERLLEHPAYEPRMAAFCILDFKARDRKCSRAERQELYDCYITHHDRITTWDMVDRSAPRVVGGYLAGGDLGALDVLARADDPLRRRTAITAPLFFVHAGSDADVAGGFAIAGMLAADAHPFVHKAVGIFLKHAGERDRRTLHDFLEKYATSMPRAALRLATEKLGPDERQRYLVTS